MLPTNQTKLKIADRLLKNYQEKLSFYYRFKISNHQNQKNKFLKGKTENPFFKYYQPRINLSQARENLRKIRIDKDSFPGEILNLKKRELLLKMRIVDSRGQNKKFRTLNKDLFGTPDQKIIKRAQKILSQKKEITQHKLLSAQKAQPIIEKQIQKYKLPYRVFIKKINARLSVLQYSIRINPQAKFLKKELKSLIFHELTHAFRRENGISQGWSLFKIGFPGYLETEEGLAGYNEINLGKNKLKLQLYAARVMACHLALKHSFREVFDFLRKHNFTEEEAWQITVRVKRGFGDTSQRGAFLKDYLYFTGYLKVKEYFQKNKNPLLLYYGKIGINDIKKLNNFKKLKYPKYIFNHDHQGPRFN